MNVAVAVAIAAVVVLQRLETTGEATMTYASASTIGVIQTISRGRLQRSCSDGRCTLTIADEAVSASLFADHLDQGAETFGPVSGGVGPGEERGECTRHAGVGAPLPPAEGFDVDRIQARLREHE
jgi:hypothetical protein